MCDICDTARKQPLKKALAAVATAMQQRSNRGRACLDELVGELAGVKPSKQDALNQELVELKDRP